MTTQKSKGALKRELAAAKTQVTDLESKLHSAGWSLDENARTIAERNERIVELEEGLVWESALASDDCKTFQARIKELEDENAVAEALLWHSVHVDEWVDVVEECQKVQARIKAAIWRCNNDTLARAGNARLDVLKILTADEPQGKDGE